MNKEKITIDYKEWQEIMRDYDYQTKQANEYLLESQKYACELAKVRNENQKLKEKQEASERARKEAIEYIKTNPLYEEEYDYNYDDELELLGINSEQAKYDLLDILDIDKGE